MPDRVYIRRMGLMQSHGLANKVSFKREKFLANPAKPSGYRTLFQKTPTCSKLLSKFLHLDENICLNDTAVDQTTNMADDMRKSP